MNNIDYIYTNNKTFAESPLNALDALAFSHLAYTRFENINMKKDKLKAFHRGEFFDKFFCDNIADEGNRHAFSAACASRRFRDLTVKKVFAKDDVDEQLAAVIFEIDKYTDFIAFRGTDGTLVGWKENCDLAIKENIPAQIDAVKFINEEYKRGKKKLYMGGHSKGGNLAIYAAAFCDKAIQDRIIKVFSFDAPGFTDEVSKKLALNKDLIINRIVPEDSIIGMLLDIPEGYSVVKSVVNGLNQHDITTWEIENEDFVYLDERSHTSRYIDKTMSAWLSKATQIEKEIFVESLFNILDDNGYETVADLMEIHKKDTMRLLESMAGLDKETKKILGSFFGSLAKSAVKNIV